MRSLLLEQCGSGEARDSSEAPKLSEQGRQIVLRNIARHGTISLFEPLLRFCVTDVANDSRLDELHISDFVTRLLGEDKDNAHALRNTMENAGEGFCNFYEEAMPKWAEEHFKLFQKKLMFTTYAYYPGEPIPVRHINGLRIAGDRVEAIEHEETGFKLIRVHTESTVDEKPVITLDPDEEVTSFCEVLAVRGDASAPLEEGLEVATSRGNVWWVRIKADESEARSLERIDVRRGRSCGNKRLVPLEGGLSLCVNYLVDATNAVKWFYVHSIEGLTYSEIADAELAPVKD